MSSTKAFRGFVPARMKGGAYNNEAVTDMITLTSTGQAQTPSNSIFTGDPFAEKRIAQLIRQRRERDQQITALIQKNS